MLSAQDIEYLSKKFILSLRQRNYSLHTIRAYSHDLGEFSDWLKKTFGGSDIRDKTRTMARAYLGWLAEKNTGPVNVARKIYALRSFSKFCRAGDREFPDFYVYIRSPKLQKRLPKFLSEA